MQRFLFALVLVCLVVPVGRAQINPDEWNTEGIKVAPAANTPLCQHIAPNDETLTFHFVVTSGVFAITFLEHMDVDGTTVIRSQAIIINAGVTYAGTRQLVTLANAQRIRLRTSTALVGPTAQIQCSLYVGN